MAGAVQAGTCTSRTLQIKRHRPTRARRTPRRSPSRLVMAARRDKARGGLRRSHIQSAAPLGPLLWCAGPALRRLAAAGGMRAAARGRRRPHARWDTRRPIGGACRARRQTRARWRPQRRPSPRLPRAGPTRDCGCGARSHLSDARGAARRPTSEATRPRALAKESAANTREANENCN